jgi:hypothetical protein
LRVREDEIRDLCKPVASGEVGTDDLDVALSRFEDVADVPAFRVLH